MNQLAHDTQPMHTSAYTPRRRRPRIVAASITVAMTALVAGCATPSTANERAFVGDDTLVPPAPVVTADIKAGIEKHIEEKTQRDGGRFVLDFEDEQLRLQLVRVHTEYLANLGPNEHFACVDLVDTKGDVYDVDFFLEGEPGSMRVTETIVHKLNGKPYYVWEQQDNGTWARVEVDDATRPLLGVIEGEDHFRFSYKFTLPDIEDGTRLWLPMPQDDDFQQVEMISAKTPVQWDVLDEQRFGNTIMYMTLDRSHSGETIEFIYEVHRKEKAAYPGDPAEAARHLTPERYVPNDPIFRMQVTSILDGVEGDLVRARKLYDHILDEMKYAKVGDYGRGDAIYACNALHGNCTDYHSYFIALARAAGIPARFAIGAPVPSDRNEGGISGYHCWAEFYAEGKWWPVDISESDKYAALATYYFGHHPANRVEFTRGRDLVVDPGPDAGSINFLAYPYLEVNGKQVSIKPFFSFVRMTDLSSAAGPCGDACCNHEALFASRRVNAE